MNTFSTTEGCRFCGGTETVEFECENGIDAPLIACVKCGRVWDEPIEYCNECDAVLGVCIKIGACGRCAALAESVDNQWRRGLRAQALRLVAKADMLRVPLSVIRDRTQDKDNVLWAYVQIEALLGEEKAASDSHP